MKYGYYPGCSLERNALSYHESSIAVAKVLGMELVEIDDWNCCGATEYHSLNMMASHALIARNLAQASKGTSKELVAPCSACYLNLRKTDKYMKESQDLNKKVNLALAAGGLAYKPGTIKVRHLLDVLYNDIGCDSIASKVTKPLKGLRIAPYYGCMIVRPEFGNNGDNFDLTEFPITLDELMTSLGAEVVYYPVKAQCCGGHMTQISEGTAFDMIQRVIKPAADEKADLIVTLCPMCQFNLDGFQGPMNAYLKTSYKMPILYFTQVIGLAFGLEARELGIGAELVDARPALAKIGAEVPAEVAPPAKAPKPKKDDKSLPMPKMTKTPRREVVK
jgi:heterodisulfide reductase subunit B2